MAAMTGYDLLSIRWLSDLLALPVYDHISAGNDRLEAMTG